jgi:UDP-N-acetylglucosamine diphosphorylase / glucose-1-phosphate thymidylyltransferase / UDP-N-acetylgalactosamine diphosphorylase / glucosamine-1-phosphate N-acetyltransferase / galactosamine-1-phosphate N-acetyltransferase
MSPGPRDRRDEAKGGFSPATVDGVLLSAGVGQRLRPLTETLPKALIPVAGRPLLEHHLEAWRSAGVRHVILVVGYREEQVRRFVRERSDFGLEIEYVTQTERRGSGHALLVSENRIRSSSILVGYCDVFFGRSPSVWKTLLANRRAKIVGASVPNASRYGRLITDGEPPNVRLVAIHEKDGIPLAGLVNAGAYLLPQRVVELLRSVPLSPRGEIELTDGVSAYVAEGGTVDVVPVTEWVDVGTPSHLEIANRMGRTPGLPDPPSQPASQTPLADGTS